MSNLNGGLSGSGTLRGTLGGGGVPAQDVYWDDILNKPNFAAVATSGSYNDLINKPNLANVATSGSYNDLTDKPTIPAAQVNADWNATSGVAEILNKPTIPAAQVNADWNATSGVAEILNKPTLAPVATSGSYNDLTNTPTIPPAQVNADWNATSGVAEILNKPTIPAAQVNADWNATSGVAEILNKPTIPTTAAQIDYDNTTSGLQADDVQDAITELKSNLTQKLNGSYELIYSGSATATATNKTLSDNKKFSDYKWLLMALDTGGGAARISASNTIPMQIFIDGMLVYASYTSAQVNIKYVSDTQFTLSADGNRAIRLYGIN